MQGAQLARHRCQPGQGIPCPKTYSKPEPRPLKAVGATVLPGCCCRLLDVAGGVVAGALGERVWDKQEERKEEKKEWERAEEVG